MKISARCFLSRLVLLVVLPLTVARGAQVDSTAAKMNAIAESYVRLALALGVHDGDYVDAYYGPPEWKAEADTAKLPLPVIKQQVHGVRAALAVLDLSGFDEPGRLRHEYLARQLRAMDARIEQLEGRKFTFDEESDLLFDAVAPVNTAEHFNEILAELDRVLPKGKGTVAERYHAFRNQFIIPPDKLDAVFQAALAASRERTRQHMALPAGEKLRVEYVTGKSWAGYNWYEGGLSSLVQVNTDLPIYIDRAVDLAAHEGYPGHHVYNVLLEKNLLRDRGWMEFCIYPLHSPQSLIAEGSANYGVKVAFPDGERVAFERDVLFPLAGLDPTRAAAYHRVLELTEKLSFAGNEAARRYLNGEISADAAATWLGRYSLMDPAHARQRVRFIDKYRSYVINYNLGQEMVRHYVEDRAQGDAGRRWAVFTELISSPRLPSGLK